MTKDHLYNTAQEQDNQPKAAGDAVTAAGRQPPHPFLQPPAPRPPGMPATSPAQPQAPAKPAVPPQEKQGDE